MARKTAATNGWVRVRFGDVVRLVRDRVDPTTSGLTRYVAGEHMDTGDLRIRRWGAIGDGYLGPAFHMRFKPGHVLYGSRRTYLRKVAIADFEGITANTTFVLEPADPSTLLPDLLPYVMRTEAFHEHSIKQSKGSVNPYVNFSDLAWYEFDLPPLEQQRKIVEVSIAHRALSDRQRDATSAADRLFQSHLTTTFAGLAANPNITSRPLGEIARVERGQFTHRPRNLPQFFGGPYPFVQTGDVAASQGYLQRASQALSEEGKTYSRSFPCDTILITIAAVIGATAITTGETWCPDSVVGIQPDARVVRVRYLEFALRHARPYLDGKVATQTAQKNINLAVLRPLPIPIPAIETQQQIETALAHVELAAQAVRHRAVATDALMRSFTGA